MLTTARQRKVIFTTCALLSSILVYEGEATEVSLAIEEHNHLQHEMHVCQVCNYHISMNSVMISTDTPYTI